jgi:acyl carrier protein
MAKQATPEAVAEELKKALAEMGAEMDGYSRDSSFEDLDVDSLDLVELAQVVEDEFGVQLSGDDMKELTTVGDAIDMVVARGA